MAGDGDRVAGSRQSRVRVWFGRHPICTFVAETEHVEEYAALIARRFRGLVVTVDDPPEDGGDHWAPLPHKLLWDTTPRLFT